MASKKNTNNVKTVTDIFAALDASASPTTPAPGSTPETALPAMGADSAALVIKVYGLPSQCHQTVTVRADRLTFGEEKKGVQYVNVAPDRQASKKWVEGVNGVSFDLSSICLRRETAPANAKGAASKSAEAGVSIAALTAKCDGLMTQYQTASAAVKPILQAAMLDAMNELTAGVTKASPNIGAALSALPMKDRLSNVKELLGANVLA